MLKTVGFPSTRTGDQTIVDGNLVIGTAGKGIDFSADPSAAGMTSELLDDYEEGTWTPSDGSGAGLSLTVTSATYTKIGNTITISANIKYPPNSNASGAVIAGLPFNLSGKNAAANTVTNSGAYVVGVVGLTNIYPKTSAYANVTNVQLTNADIFINATYQL